MRCSAIVAALVSGLVFAAPNQAAVLIDNGTNNGGFESNGGAGTSTFSNWTVVNESGSSGDWYVQSGIQSKNSYGVASPPQGSYAAMTDTTAPGSHIMYQDFVVPLNITSATLSFEYYVNNRGGSFTAPGGPYSQPSDQYSYSNAPNQEAYVDITNGISTAGWSAAANAGVVDNVLTATMNQLSYATNTTDLTSYFQSHQGQPMALRFTEVDGGQAINFGIDNVVLTYQTSAPSVVPEPASMAIWGIAMFGFAARLCGRKRAAVCHA